MFNKNNSFILAFRLAKVPFILNYNETTVLNNMLLMKCMFSVKIVFNNIIYIIFVLNEI